MSNRLFGRVTKWAYSLLRAWARPVVHDILTNDQRVFGSADRVSVAETAEMVNTLFNTVSGRIEVGEFTFAGHNVCLLTGTHDYSKTDRDRMDSAPKEGRDIVIGRGVWIGSNSVILGPCRVGDNSVVAAGAIVTEDVPSGVIVGGIPAKVIKYLEPGTRESGTD